MASIEITPDELIVRVRGWSRAFAMRGTLRIPMSHVRSARVRPRAARFDDVIVDSWRGWGAKVPHKLTAGLLVLEEGGPGAVVSREESAIAVDVDHENVRHLVIQVDGESPERAVRRIEEAIGTHRRKVARTT